MKLSLLSLSKLLCPTALFLASVTNAQVHPDIVITVDVEGANPGPGWFDSYSVGTKCYCSPTTTYDHGIGTFQIETPVGWMTVEEACTLLGSGPGVAGRPKYNDIQCGNGPPNDAGDEHTCPGRTDIGPTGCGQIGPKWDFTGLTGPTPAPVAAPTPAPVTAPTPAPVPAPIPAPISTPAPVSGPTPITSFFVDCGSGEENLLSGTYWTDTSGNSIANTGSYSQSVFQSARSGTGFTYTIPGFASGAIADITLGWAELWGGACASGKRQLDVDVNGLFFVSDFDVGATAGGCYSAVFATATFAADSSGTFALAFTKGSIQNPLINMIDIQVI